MPTEQLKKIPRVRIQEIIRNCSAERTKALIAFQYFFARRGGELAEYYVHDKYYQGRERYVKKDGKIRRKHKLKLTQKQRTSLQARHRIQRTTEGLLMRNVIEESRGYLIKFPTLKNMKAPYHDVIFPKESNYPDEQYLIDIIINWIKQRKGKYGIFSLKQRRIKQLIGEELQKYDSNYTTHWLRSSRITELNERFGWTVRQIQIFVNHLRTETTASYIKPDLRQVMFNTIGKKGDINE